MNGPLSSSTPIFCPQEYSILLVDDDFDQLSHFQAFLTLHGFRVHVASTPREALILLRKIYIDIVISDLRMPGAHVAAFRS